MDCVLALVGCSSGTSCGSLISTCWPDWIWAPNYWLWLTGTIGMLAGWISTF